MSERITWRAPALLAAGLAAAACGSKATDNSPPASAAPRSAAGSAAAAAPVDGAAGQVVDLAGKATARLGDRVRTLAVGDRVTADDVIETGADGRVVIQLAHNLAKWELGASRQQKVRESILWKVPKQDGNASIVIQDMSAKRLK